jgi:hypothetical protein
MLIKNTEQAEIYSRPAVAYDEVVIPTLSKN